MEQNKMTPTPWKIRKHKSWSTNVVGKDELNDICEMSGTHSKSIQNANASAIVSAINNTYGAGINPEAVPELIKAAIALLAYEQKEGLFDDYVNNGDGYSPTLEVSGTLRIILNAIKSTIEKAKL